MREAVLDFDLLPFLELVVEENDSPDPSNLFPSKGLTPDGVSGNRSDDVRNVWRVNSRVFVELWDEEGRILGSKASICNLNVLDRYRSPVDLRVWI